MGTSSKKKIVFKVLIIIAVVAVLAFAVYNIIWLVFFNRHVKPFRDAIGYDEARQRYYTVDEDKYSFSISYYYLRFDAELHISEVISEDDKVQALMDITVTSDGNDYNAVLNYNDGKGPDGQTKHDTRYFHLNSEIKPIDPDGNVTENLSDEEKSQYDKAYPELKILFDKANAMWSGLND